MYLESMTQKLGFCCNSKRTWIRDSSERRKKPRREDSGRERVEVTETPETAMVTWPVCVNPNFSKRIMGRESEVIFKVLISAVVRWRRVRKRRTMARSIFAIVGGGGGDLLSKRVPRWI